MYILSKHILKQHIGPFLFGLFIITLLFMLNLVFKELGRILSKGLDFFTVVEFFALNLSWIVALAVPMAVLMACLMAFGQLSADHEITAIKASGISLYRILLPVFLVAIGLTLFLIWFNNDVLPDSNHRLRLLARDITIKKPTVTLEAGYLNQDIPNISIRVNELTEKENLSMIRDVIIYDNSDPNVNKTVIAERGQIYVNKNNGILQITLYNGEIHEIRIDKLDNYTRINFPEHVMRIPIPNMVLQRSDSEYRGDREQSTGMMKARIAENTDTIEKRYKNLLTFIEAQIYRYFPKNTDTALQQFEDPMPVLAPLSLKQSPRFKLNLQKQIRACNNVVQRIDGEIDVARGHELSNNRLRVEIYKKVSIPFACIVFVLIGAPLGILAKRGNMAIGGGISLIFFIVYWIFLIGGEELADRDMLSPFLSMWLANFIVGGFGVYLLLRTVKESSFINFNSLVKFIPKRLRAFSE
ncbi:MAG: LptF/LptG family permease [Candidatus Zhuqueibacterota bacterium]